MIKGSVYAIISQVRDTVKHSAIQSIDCKCLGLWPSDIGEIGLALVENFETIQRDGCSSPIVSIDLSSNKICEAVFMNHEDSYDYSGLRRLISSLMLLGRYCRLRRLVVSNNKIGSDGLAIISDLISRDGIMTFSELCCRGCEIRDSYLDLFCTLLAENNRLSVLDLSCNPIGNHGCGIIANSLKVNKGLKTLSLENCRMTGVGLNELFHALTMNSTLQSLDLSNCKISDSDIEHMWKNLNNCAGLTGLNLASNEISDFGMKKLMMGLEGNNSLETLNIEWNKMTEKSVDSLLLMAKSNSTLRYLCLCGNDVSFESLQRVRACRSENRNFDLSIDLLD